MEAEARHLRLTLRQRQALQHVAKYGPGREQMRALDWPHPGAGIDQAPPPDHLLGPLAVHLEVIGACNLTCTHCFAGELPRNHHPLRFAHVEGLFVERLFAQLAGLVSFRLGLTGGESLHFRNHRFPGHF
ncbi:hypothetical protein [Stigmatella aurantiaca]|uniref:Molybdenum cofactor biosynthesis protein n=1 Tax=Stigmatella aurantiaca (strain DW4/3-1) TaxID=378806 RepID=Q09DW4_STIAD|nr:hypothetical protein [Stigmatella aurantiaca]ADO75197.1 uncharacterized protein STAUR_7441 [Stigmatella aurantiaca DW4/3-1]EAU69945.1 molybdenum cofactor biosynthesis protein [Stigmatella aurantiaca DW4/3-1]